MNINVEHQSNCRAVVHVHATAEEVAKQRSNLIAYYTRGAKIPGYRPGKVPPAIILKTYGAAITEELERQLASDGLQTAIKNEGLDILIKRPAGEEAWRGPYLDEDIPKDPWGNDYVYQAPATSSDRPVLSSLGGDGKSGGDGNDADIFSRKVRAE